MRIHVNALSGLAISALVALAAASPSQAAKLKGYMEICAGNKICPWYAADFTPPAGWLADEKWTQRYHAVFMFPGGDQSTSVPVMYVRAHPGDGGLSIESYIKGAQDRWKSKVRDAGIEQLDDLTREGKPGFKVYLYRNASAKDQGYELTAFMKDIGTDHPNQTFYFQVVLSSPSMEELEKAKPAFYEVLKGL
jgi:hypothetical protein